MEKNIVINFYPETVEFSRKVKMEVHWDMIIALFQPCGDVIRWAKGTMALCDLDFNMQLNWSPGGSLPLIGAKISSMA